MYRLQDYLVHYHLTHKLGDLDRGAIAETTIPEYAALWRLLETQTITVDQARHILQAMVQETLFDLLSLHQGHFNFQLGTPFGPQLSTYAVTSLLFETVKKSPEMEATLSPDSISPTTFTAGPTPKTCRRATGDRLPKISPVDYRRNDSPPTGPLPQS